MGNVGKVTLYRGLPVNSINVEQGIDVIHLTLGDGTTGFSLQSNGWNPQRAGSKGGGSWADSPTQPGRTPLSLEPGNVTETFNLTLTAGSWQTYNRYMSKLENFLATARAFATDFDEIEPVYIGWHPPGATNEQYALIYDGSVADVKDNGQAPISTQLTLIVEREPYWRVKTRPGVVPDGNEGFLLASKVLYNRTTFTEATPIEDTWLKPTQVTLGPDTVDLSNKLHISKAGILGDAPGLAYLELQRTSGETPSQVVIAGSTVYVSNRKRPKSLPDYNGKETEILTQMVAADGKVTTVVAGSGGIVNDLQGLRGAYTGATSVFRVTSGRYALDFNYSDGDEKRLLDVNRWAGRYLVFVRARNDTVATICNTALRLKITEREVGSVYTTSTDIQTSLDGSQGIYIIPLGTLTIPLRAKARYNAYYEGSPPFDPLAGRLGYNSTPSYGEDIEGNLQIRLEAEVLSGSGTIDILDICFVPYENDLVILNGTGNSLSGYAIANGEIFGRGYNSPAVFNLTPREFRPGSIPVLGQNIYMYPDSDNEISMFVFSDKLDAINADPGAGNIVSAPFVTVYYVPRVTGAADF